MRWTRHVPYVGCLIGHHHRDGNTVRQRDDGWHGTCRWCGVRLVRRAGGWHTEQG